MEIIKFVEVMTKMVETSDNQLEMQRYEKIFNRMLRNIIEILKKDVSSKATMINEL